MFRMPQKRTLEERRAIFERNAERIRLRLQKRRTSPRHRKNVTQMLDKWQRNYALGPRSYFITRWPIWVLVLTAAFLGIVYLIDSSFQTLLQPRVASLFILALLLGGYIVTLVGWRLMKPL